MIKRCSVAVAVLLALWIVSLSFAQNPPAQRQAPRPATASISGTVAAMGTNTPIAGARVEAREAECNGNSSPTTVTATTNAEGKFLLERLRAGSWCVGAAYPGGQYTPAEYMQRGALGRGLAVSVTDGQRIENIRIAMAPTGGIAGRVTDADGEPMGRVRVMVMEAFYEEGRKRLYTLNVVQSDDLGDFRFFWLPPGQYYVAAIPEDTDRARIMFNVSPPGSGGHRTDVVPPVSKRRITPAGEVIDEAYLAVYYPGVTDSQRAAPVTVNSGVTTSGVTFTFAGARVRAWRVRGTVASAVIPNIPRGAPPDYRPPPAQIRLAPRDWTSIAVMPSATADANGNFEIAGVVSGSYVLYATTPGASARIPLDVNGDVNDLRVVTAGPFRVSGRVMVEGQQMPGPQGSGMAMRVNLVRDPNFPGLPTPNTNTSVNANDLTFTLANLSPGDYRVYLPPFLNPFQRGGVALPGSLQRFYLKSLRLGSSDLLTDVLRLSGPPDSPIEIVLGVAGTLTGRVVDNKGQAAANVKVALIPDVARRNRYDLYRTASTNESGSFQVRGVAPGDYTVLAWEQVPDGAWQDPEFLRTYETQGKPAHVSDGAQSSVELTVIGN